MQSSAQVCRRTRTGRSSSAAGSAGNDRSNVAGEQERETRQFVYETRIAGMAQYKMYAMFMFVKMFKDVQDVLMIQR